MRRVHARSTVPSLLVALLACACGGGGGAGGMGGSGGGGNPPPAGTVARVFPPYDGSTEAASLVVRGTASSADGIASVTVAGVAATSNDGFATFAADVPLSLGANLLPIEATTGAGATLSVPAVSVRRETAFLGAVFGVAYDASAHRVYTLGGLDPRLYAYDEMAQVASVIASDAKGTGPSLDRAYPVLVHPSASRAYVASNSSGPAILAVDLVTGDRTVVSGPNVGQGPALLGISDLEHDVAGNRLLVTDYSIPAILWVDLGTGDRTIVSSDLVGSGAPFQKGSATSTALDLAQGRAFVAQSSTYKAVDLVTGNRVVVSSPNVGTGPNASSVSIAYDAASDRILVGTRAKPTGFVSIDPVTGNRTQLPSPAVAPGSPFTADITAVVHDPAGSRLLLADWEGAAIRAYDLASGVQTDVWRPGRGTGVEPLHASAATLAGDDRVLLADEFHQNALVSVDLATGSRTLFDGGGVSISLSDLFSPGALATDGAHGRVLFSGAVGGAYGVAAIDLVTGVRTTLSSGVPGFGPTWNGTTGLATDGTTAWVSTKSPAGVLAVDLATGMRTTVTGSGIGQGGVFASVEAVLRDPTGPRLFVGGTVTGVENGIFSVDLATGDRTPLYTTLAGTGPKQGPPSSLATMNGGASLAAAGGQTILSVDVAGATGTTLASNSTGGGVRLRFARVAGVRSDGILIVHDDGTNAVLAIDPTNGTRLVLSK